jgi:SPFH domain / Band 7 family
MRQGHALSQPPTRGIDNAARHAQRGPGNSAAVSSRRAGGRAIVGRIPWPTWWRVGTGGTDRAAGGPQGASPLWYRTLRRWSPGLMPPLLGTLLLLLAGFLAVHEIGLGQPRPLVDPRTLVSLFIIYLVVGTAYGILLYRAADVTVWWVVLVGGISVYLVATIGVLGGPLAGVLTTILLAALVARYSRLRSQAVPEGHVLVTTLSGAYHRTLGAGTAVLLPGEHAAATLDVTERRFICPTQRVGVPVGDGETYTARAAVTVAYNLQPAEAYRAALAPEQWEDRLHDLVCTSLQRALSEWGRRMIASEGLVPEGVLARTMLGHLRTLAREQGVHISWVNVRDIWLAPSGETLLVDGWGDGDELDEQDEDERDTGAGAAYDRQRGQLPSRALPPVRRSTLRTPPPEPAPPAASDTTVAETSETTSEADELNERDLLDASVLSDAYEAVREGHIHDPATIRELAQAFLRIAAEPELNADFPYDATAAAQILLERAQRLERDQQTNARPFDGN